MLDRTCTIAIRMADQVSVMAVTKCPIARQNPRSLLRTVDTVVVAASRVLVAAGNASVIPACVQKLTFGKHRVYGT